MIALGLLAVQGYADTDVVNKKVNERYTNNPAMHAEVENTKGNSDGYYEHPNNNQHEANANSVASKVTTDSTTKAQNNIQNTTQH